MNSGFPNRTESEPQEEEKTERKAKLFSKQYPRIYCISCWTLWKMGKKTEHKYCACLFFRIGTMENIFSSVFSPTGRLLQEQDTISLGYVWIQWQETYSARRIRLHIFAGTELRLYAERNENCVYCKRTIFWVWRCIQYSFPNSNLTNIRIYLISEKRSPKLAAKG